MSVFYSEGIYAVKVTNQAMAESSNSNPQFVLQFEVLGQMRDDDSGTYDPCTKYERTSYMTFTEKTVGFLLEDLKAIGFRGTSFSKLDPRYEDYQSFLGEELLMECSHETYEGNEKERWRIHRERSSGMEIKELDKKNVRKMDAMWGKALKDKCAPGPEEKKPEKQPERETVPTSTDDEIPF